MRSIKFGFASAIGIAFSLYAISAPANTAPKNPGYDAELAAKLGGDEHGMRNYVFVILKTGPNDANFKDKARADLFAGHMTNIGR